VYPVLVVDEASTELRQFAVSYAPKHCGLLPQDASRSAGSARSGMTSCVPPSWL
jgi:hypothetical protein